MGLEALSWDTGLNTLAGLPEVGVNLLFISGSSTSLEKNNDPHWVALKFLNYCGR